MKRESPAHPVPLASRWRARLRPPRRLRLRRSGLLLIGAVLSLGLATLNTGNNLLYLLVGAMLGLITLSGWVSERSLSGIRVSRQLPFGATAGQPVRIEYRVENRKRRLPSGGLELRDLELVRGSVRVRPVIHEPASLGLISAGESATAAEVLTIPRRGIYHFGRLVLETSYPFGLFTKERDLLLPGSIVVWPRSDRPVPRLFPAGGRDAGRRTAADGALAGSGRGEYRGLRAYRPGDDPRDVHWRSTARRAEPIVREYDRDPAESWWLLLDLYAPGDAAGEAAIELAASVAADAAARAARFGFAAGGSVLPPGRTGARLDAVLDLLARVELGADDLVLPAPPADCVLVTARPEPRPGFAAVLSPVSAGPA